MAAVGLMAALTAAGAFIRIPLPNIPITLQLPFVCIGSAYLGGRRGAASQAIYLAVGLIGFPVFAKGGGPQYVFEPSFGYLLGFIPGAFIIGHIADASTALGRCVWAMLLGLSVVYISGITYLWIIMRFLIESPLSTAAIIQLGAAPLLKDVLLCFPAAYTVIHLQRLRAF